MPSKELILVDVLYVTLCGPWCTRKHSSGGLSLRLSTRARGTVYYCDIHTYLNVVLYYGASREHMSEKSIRLCKTSER